MTRPTFCEITLKTIVAHTLTYFAVGWAAFSIADYPALYAQPDMAALMRQVTDPMVSAGPLFQPVRGFLLGVVIYLVRDAVFPRKNGWLVLWAAFVGLGIFSTFGPAPGSIEGLVYTRISPAHQLAMLPEVALQSLALSLGVFYWVNRPGSKWVTGLAVSAFVVVLALAVFGLLLA